MGLDMYLSATKDVADYPHSKKEESKQFAGVLAAVGLDDSHCRRCRTPALDVKVTVAYWRKANHIHQWFVEHCQGGTDDCRDAYVEREQLEELLQLCQQVLGTLETVDGEIHTATTYHPDGRVEHSTQPGRVVAHPKIAADLLPTQQGFFFGGTDYDEYYMKDTQETVTVLEAVLADERLKGWDFEYHASW